MGRWSNQLERKRPKAIGTIVTKIPPSSGKRRTLRRRLPKWWNHMSIWCLQSTFKVIFLHKILLTIAIEGFIAYPTIWTDQICVVQEIYPNHFIIPSPFYHHFLNWLKWVTWSVMVHMHAMLNWKKRLNLNDIGSICFSFFRFVLFETFPKTHCNNWTTPKKKIQLKEVII